MNVTEAALYYEDGTGFGAPVEAEKAGLNVTLDLVDITYRENIGNTVLVVTGENGTTYELHINEVGIIDKTPAEIAVDYTPGAPRQSAEIIFTPNEEVLCSQITSPVWFGPDNPLTVTADENGTYEYSFTDSAGNISSVSVEVTDIDHTSPVLSFSLTSGGQEYASWNELAALNDVSSIESAYIKADEDSSYTFQETSGTLTAGTWTQLAIEKTSVYNLTVKDTAGNVTATALNGILIPDSEPPVIWLSPTFISVPQGSSGTELDTLMRQGIVVSDNTSSAANVTVTWDAAALNTGVTGQYIVTYTAADEAGNTSSADRTVRVFGSDDALLGVNDKDTTYMGTLMLDTGELVFDVGNLKGANGVYEPYMLYIKKGYKTAGQMKNNSTLINDNRVTVSGSGFYTVYLMTQSRRQYITYLYIEQ